MNKIDKRWAEELAKRPVGKKRGTGLVIAGFIMFLVGGFMGVNSYNMEQNAYVTNMVIPAIIILLAGLLFIIVAFYQNGKREKQYQAEFMEYFNQHGDLPPYPEETVETKTDKGKPA